MSQPQTKRFRILRRCLVGLGICATLICFFYTEELWRGKRAWEKCKRELEAQGVDLKWADVIPAPVPDDENFFGVPEMQKWFTGRGHSDLYDNLALGFNISESNRMVVAELTIGLPGTPVPGNVTALQLDDPASRAEAARLLTNALGPTTTAPQSQLLIGFMLRRPEEIQPAKMFVQCQAAPTQKQLQQFLPASVLTPASAALNFEPDGAGSYHVTLPVLVVAADYLAWSEHLEPQLTLIRQAMQRPSARMLGDYTVPHDVPIPNFVTLRALAQTVASRAECHFLLNQPAEALRDLTFFNDVCRPIMEENRPMTLVSAMVNVAVRGLYANTIAHGLQLQAWREPQLAALEEQLKQINVLVPVKQSFEMERLFLWRELETKTPSQLAKIFVTSYKTGWKSRQITLAAAFIPQGWFYQNMVYGANFYPDLVAYIDPTNQSVFPDKLNAFVTMREKNTAISPYSFIANLMTPNYVRACQTTAHNQTLINQALIACALERHHFAHGEYPETLDALVPQFLEKIPHDPIGGQPPHYHRDADGTFTLYSIGWSGRDKHGIRSKAANSYSFSEGDWVWPY